MMFSIETRRSVPPWLFVTWITSAVAVAPNAVGCPGARKSLQGRTHNHYPRTEPHDCSSPDEERMSQECSRETHDAISLSAAVDSNLPRLLYWRCRVHECGLNSTPAPQRLLLVEANLDRNYDPLQDYYCANAPQLAFHLSTRHSDVSTFWRLRCTRVRCRRSMEALVRN